VTELTKRVARACLDSTEVNLSELKQYAEWWACRSEAEKAEFKEFLAQVIKWANDLRG
jgi:hypothetical protein